LKTQKSVSAVQFKKTELSVFGWLSVFHVSQSTLAM